MQAYPRRGEFISSRRVERAGGEGGSNAVKCAEKKKGSPQLDLKYLKRPY